MYGFHTIGALPGKFVDATGVSLRVSATYRPIENARMSSWPPRRALTFPTVSEASQAQPVHPPDVSEHRIPSDEELMARLQSNDTNALEILFHRYARLVFRIARGVVRDSGEAEDVVQEAFFHLYKKSMLFDRSKGGAKNWIVQIALHRALDRKAHLSRRGFYLGTNINSLDDTLLGRTDLDREIGCENEPSAASESFRGAAGYSTGDS